MRELALFAGAGGGLLGGYLLGWQTVCAVEIEKYPVECLLQRQCDGILPRFPIWDDIRTFDGIPWRGRVDIITGGFPCQDISAAGKGVGIQGERSGLWGEMARIIGEVRPRWILVENSPLLTIRGLGRVLGDLSQMGYDARWCVLGAGDLGFDHLRRRIWILAYPDKEPGGVLYRGAFEKNRNMEEHKEIRSPIDRFMEELERERKQCEVGRKDNLPPYLCRVDNGLADGMDRLRAIGNGQVPAVAAIAFLILSQGLIEMKGELK